ncbi:MAG: ferredoxin [Myxococcota bacterium]|jgi:ferredoxin|nr:ferredoxin [Deltaproteobacteria bacterium]MCP4242769.1 ferredoxin [bacterium]MDP7075291.1 ferredoxin [Myxococcota bacterium]MCP4905081.1 ferredoxin [bacterium]MDP7299155.1 ferredoxin [Myxococcota bacterium]|tara:strand:+ start:117 stop:305 length:189 start_codon:yes stop_codon:yes gene_type:complete
MKIRVDRDLCEANAICQGCAPAVFRVEEDDTLTLLIEEVSDDLAKAVAEAIRLCPRQALQIE